MNFKITSVISSMSLVFSFFQTLTNVKMEKILVTRMPCVQTLWEVMCVAASGVLMVMA